MSNDADQRSMEPEKMTEDLHLQARQTIALEKIAATLDDIREAVGKVGDALLRISNRVGRREDS